MPRVNYAIKNAIIIIVSKAPDEGADIHMTIKKQSMDKGTAHQ